MADLTLAPHDVSATDTIKTTGILHFTIGVRDHLAAAKFYSELLGIRIIRTNERYAFMDCHGDYFVLAKTGHHVNPNPPGEDAHHHAFMVEEQEFDRAMAILKARGIKIIKYEDAGHRTFPGHQGADHERSLQTGGKRYFMHKNPQTACQASCNNAEMGLIALLSCSCVILSWCASGFF